MKRLHFLCALWVLVLAVATPAAGADWQWPSRDGREKKSVGTEWSWQRLGFHSEDVGFFDNREVHSPYQRSQTLFGSRMGAELSVGSKTSSLNAGYYVIDEFGRDGLTDHGFTLFFHYQDKDGISGAFGSFPRRLLKRELPSVFVSDSLLYFTPNLNGALIQYESRNGFVELYCDWLSRQSLQQREIFEIVSDGETELLRDHSPHSLKAAYNARLTHFSVRSGHQGDFVYDKLMVNPYLEATFRWNGLIEALRINGGYMLSLNRDRGDNVWKAPMGFLGDASLDIWRFELRNRLYVGNPLMSDFETYGRLLHRGDPYYRSGMYDRTDVSFRLLNKQRVQCSATASFHATEGTLDYSQLIHCRIVL